MQHRILVSNLGYARDIDGTPMPHLLRSWRHFRTPHGIQRASLDAYRAIIDRAKPDICCMLEVDTGSFTSGKLDQFAYIKNDDYPYFDISSKYAPKSRVGKLTPMQGKSNGFMARKPYAFERLYLSRGSKRLLYRIALDKDLTLFFTHLSLGLKTRTLQLRELRALADREETETLIAGDFNILAGLDELETLLGDGRYHLLNDKELSTFTLFNKHYLLDLCIASTGAAKRARVDIIDQPFSDHDALLVSIEGNPE